MDIGDIVRLKPQTRRGKNALQNKVNKWFVAEHSFRVLFSDKKGPWVRLVEMREDDREPSMRWVHGDEDEDFSVLDSEGVEIKFTRDNLS